MIEFNVQLFAKSAAYQGDYRKRKAIEIAKKEEGAVKEKIKEEEKAAKKRAPGEAVSAVRMQEVYEIYKIEGGKEVPVVRDGKRVFRTGAEILAKMEYRSTLGKWVSKAKGKGYIVRKRTH